MEWDAVMPREGELFLSLSVSFEEYMSRQLPGCRAWLCRWPLADGDGHLYVQACRISGLQGYRVFGCSTVAPPSLDRRGKSSGLTGVTGCLVCGYKTIFKK